MYNILSNSKSGMIASQNKVDIISSNVVNVNTTGYKKLEIGFLDLYTETLDRKSYPVNSKTANTGTGVKTSDALRNFSQGSLKNTGIKTNMAIDGEGFFRVTRSDGSYAYTRNGEFNVDALGKLVDDSGNVLDIKFENKTGYNNIDLQNGDLSINKLGEVFVNRKKVGNIELYSAIGDNDFLPAGDSLFVPSNENNVITVNKSNIIQGHIEMANIEMQQEMTDLILAQRALQFNSKGIQAVDDMWSMVNNLQSR